MPRVITLSGLGNVQPPFAMSYMTTPFVTPQPGQNPLLPTYGGCGTPIQCARSALNGLTKLSSLGRVQLGQAEGEPPLADPTSSLVAFYSHPLVRLASLVATGAAAYHGYKRNHSIGWAVWWGLMGALFPVITIPVAFAQGFAKRG